MKHPTHMHSRQRGAALVVGLLLLVVLTLLAVSGMNTASTELVMAGNEQYRQSAFHAAETGIEQALSVLATVPQTGTAVVVDPTDVPGSAHAEYSTSSRYVGDDLNVPGFSAGKFVGLHYEIASTGMSARNANAQHLQGAYVIQSTGSGGGGTVGTINPIVAP
jgi:type IV pilus assembly protein PilX